MATAIKSAATAAPAAPAASTAKTYTVYRDFNTSVFEGRIQHVELKTAPDGTQFVAVTAITNLRDGEQGVALRFTSSNGICKLAVAGHLMPGRRVHITGTIAGFENAFINSDGVVAPLQRPRLQLQGVQLRLGAKPSSAMKASA